MMIIGLRHQVGTDGMPCCGPASSEKSVVRRSFHCSLVRPATSAITDFVERGVAISREYRAKLRAKGKA